MGFLTHSQIQIKEKSPVQPKCLYDSDRGRFILKFFSSQNERNWNICDAVRSAKRLVVSFPPQRLVKVNDKLSVTHVFSCYFSIFLLIKRLLPVIGRDGRDGREGREGPPGPPGKPGIAGMSVLIRYYTYGVYVISPLLY